MGVTDRLLARLRVDDTELNGVDDADLQTELEARVAARRKKTPPTAQKNPRSKIADSSAASTGVRAQMSQRRRAKVHAIRNKRVSARKRAEDEAFRRVKEQARSYRPSSSSSSSSSAGAGSTRASWRDRASAGLGNLGRDEKIARHYKVLDLPYGADRDQVKTAYRKLMRKYHPDLHNQSPRKQKAATELTMKVTQAYNGLEQYLKDKA